MTPTPRLAPARLRAYEPHERDALLQVINAVCQEGEWMTTLAYEPTPLWEHALRDPACSGHRLVVLEVGRALVGWCRLFPAEACGAGAAVAELGVGIASGFREQGLGTRLIRYTLALAPHSGIRAVSLQTKAGNGRAIHVFNTCGFAVQSVEASGSVSMLYKVGEKHSAMEMIYE